MILTAEVLSRLRPRPPGAPSRGHEGFTLAHLMVTIGIMGVLLAAAAPSVATTIRIYSLRGAAREVFAELQNARMAAVMENNRYRVRADADGHTFGSPKFQVGEKSLVELG